MKFLFSLGGVLMEGLAGALMATSTGRCHRQLQLKFVEGCATLLDSARDVAVGDSVADTNNHKRNVMRMVRIGKRIEKPARCWG